MLNGTIPSDLPAAVINAAMQRAAQDKTRLHVVPVELPGRTSYSILTTGELMMRRARGVAYRAAYKVTPAGLWS